MEPQRPTSYYLRPSYLDDWTQLITWNDVDEAEVVRYEVGISLDTSELNLAPHTTPENPILVAFPRDYFTCVGHKSLVVRTNIDQAWAIKVRVRSVNDARHQSHFPECHLGTDYEAEYDGRFVANEHTEEIPDFPFFQMSDVDSDEWSENLFPSIMNWKWSCFCSIEETIASFGRKHWQVTRKQDGKVVQRFDRSIRRRRGERHIPHTVERIQEKVPGLSYPQHYKCCVEDYEQGRRRVDLEARFERSDDRVSMQTRTRERLQRVEMGTGAEYAPRLEDGGWICCEAP